jgi:hypothetical protein
MDIENNELQGRKENRIFRLPDGLAYTDYEGELSAGLPHGQGRIVAVSGNIYEGDFINGYREGWGK